MRHLTKFVDDFAESKSLSLSADVRTDCVSALRIAGFSDPQKLSERKSLAQKVVEQTLSRVKGAPIAHTSGGRVTTAAVISAGQNCPRCGSIMSQVQIGRNGPMGAICRNAKCRTSCYLA